MKTNTFTHRINDVITELRFGDDYVELKLENTSVIKVSSEWAFDKLEWLCNAIKQKVTVRFDIYPNGELSDAA